MEMIPEDTPIQSIKEFLTKVLQESTIHKRRSHVLRSLLLAENLRVIIYHFVKLFMCSTHL